MPLMLIGLVLPGASKMGESARFFASAILPTLFGETLSSKS